MNFSTKTNYVLSRQFRVITASVFFALTMTATAVESSKFVVQPVENPRYCGNELFRAFENYSNSRIKQLRSRYGLDAVVAGESDEWKRILLLRHWIRSNIAIENDNPTQTRGDTFAILDAALKGGKFHCTHFSIVQHAVLNSFGYVTRRDWIEWTPNVITSKVTISDSRAHVFLGSCTPNFRSFQLMDEDGTRQ